MSFQPQANAQLDIDGATYRIAEHPAAPGMPYGQEGRQATVYQLLASNERHALKVFKPRFRVPALVASADRLAAFADLPGLEVCRRTVLTPQHQSTILREYPDLTYAVLMAWIEGPTWWQLMIEKRALTPDVSLTLANEFVSALAALEQHGVAHCDLSGPNVILPALAPSSTPDSRNTVALVDIEELYAPGLERPSALPAGSPGYAHKTAPEGLWSAPADRFAGAILIAELLGYCDERMRSAAWGESFFEPDEVQRDSARYQIAVTALRERWGDRVAELFQRAWHSDSLLDCATFGEWQTALPASRAPIIITPTPRPESPEIDLLLARARRFDQQNDLPNAIAAYTAIIARLPEQAPLRTELDLIRADLQKRQQIQSEAEQAARQADAQMQAERWNDAAQFLKAAIAQFPRSAQAEQWRAALKRCEEENELATLFDHGVEALQRRERMAASELLRQVVHRRPGYTRKGQRAATLLDQSLRAETHAQSPFVWALGIVGAIVLVALCAFGGVYVWLNALAPTPTRPPLPTVAPTMRAAPPIAPSPTAIPRLPTAPPPFAPLPTYTLYPTAPPPPTLTPLPQWNTVFEDLFNDSSLNSSKWIVNNPSGDILISGSFLRLSSSSNRFPYVYPRNDPFPPRGDFRFVAQFRYVRVDDCGVGILITSFLPSPGTPLDTLNSQMQSAEQNGITAGVWQGISDNMQIWYRAGNERPSQRVSTNDTSSHTMEIRYSGNQYTLSLDGRTIFTSSPTSARPHTIWIGHPAALGGSCRWSILETDSIRVESLY